MLMMVMLSVLFLGGSQPILIVLSLILVTLLYSLYIFLMSGSYWFSYGLVLVMLSGVLVVFSYMASMSPNESFEIYGLIFFFLSLFYISYNIMYCFLMSGDLISLNLWYSYVGLISLFMVSFLLGIMVLVVWISSKNKGALRVN